MKKLMVEILKSLFLFLLRISMGFMVFFNRMIVLYYKDAKVLQAV